MLTHFGHGEYDPTIRRFITLDPVCFAGCIKTVRLIIRIFMNIILPFLLGNFAKFCAHLFFPYEELADITVAPIVCIIIYFSSKNKFSSYLIVSLGYAAHEYLFSSIGISLGLIYEQYSLANFYIAFLFFFILQIIIHFILICSGAGFKIIRSRIKNK